MNDILFFSMLNTLVLIYWFKTDLVVQYAEFLDGIFPGWLDLTNFQNLRKTNPILTFQEYFLSKAHWPFETLIYRLLSCFYCMAFWLGIAEIFVLGFSVVYVIFLSTLFYLMFDKLETKN